MKKIFFPLSKKQGIKFLRKKRKVTLKITFKDNGEFHTVT